MQSKSVAIYFVHAALKHFQDAPDLVRRLLDINNISDEILSKPNARVPAEDYANLVRDLMIATKDELIGYGGNPQPLGSWATMGQLVIGSENLGDALKRFARFYRLIPWGVSTQLSIEGTTAVFSLNNISETIHFDPYLYETFLFYIYRMCNWMLSKQIALEEVNFCFPETPQSDEYKYMFLTRRINFDSEATQIRFSSAYLNEPLRQNALSLSKFLNHANLALINHTDRHKSWSYRVENLLFKNVAANLTIVDVAAELDVHPHTLRSHLRREGLKFPEIKDRVRLDSALQMLRRERLSVEETAHRIGFSESSSFIRAFKKWTDVTPGDYIGR